MFQARNVQYVDTAEEEWAKFQKEMVEEMSVAQDILVEDRIEATNDRQIEEIDEQMRAWSRLEFFCVNAHSDDASVF